MSRKHTQLYHGQSRCNHTLAGLALDSCCWLTLTALAPRMWENFGSSWQRCNVFVNILTPPTHSLRFFAVKTFTESTHHLFSTRPVCLGSFHVQHHTTQLVSLSRPSPIACLFTLRVVDSWKIDTQTHTHTMKFNVTNVLHFSGTDGQTITEFEITFLWDNLLLGHWNSYLVLVDVNHTSHNCHSMSLTAEARSLWGDSL